MPQPQTFTDEQLREYLRLFKDDPAPGRRIATILGVSRAAVSKRIKRLERKSSASDLAVIDEAKASVFDIRSGLQRHYSQLEALLDRDLSALERVRVLAESRRYLESAFSVLQVVYNVEEIKAFQEDIVAVISDCAPDLKRQVLERIKARRGVLFTSQ